MLIVTNLAGEALPLSKVDFLARTRGTNGDYEIKLIARDKGRNSKVFDLIEHESIITLPDGNKFRIKVLEKTVEGDVLNVEVTALHVFYDNIDNYQYDIIEGEKVLSVHQALTHAFEGTDVTFTVYGDFKGYSFEDFGDDNSISLFNKAKDLFEFEFIIDNNNHLEIYNRTGKNDGMQMRWKHNIVTIKQEDNTQNLTTYIKGNGNPKEDKDGNPIEGEYIVATDYTSPNAKKYGIRHAEPYYNEKITHEDTMLEYLANNIIDEPEMTFEITYEELVKNVNKDLGKADLG